MKKKNLLIPIIVVLLLIMMPNVNASGLLSEMPNGSYIIGESLYTRSAFGDYKGVLKTEFIMMASKTISEDALASMKIYYKTPRGVLTDALTGEQVDVSEVDLMNNINYYNGKKLPTLTMDYIRLSNGTSFKYNVGINTIENEDGLWHYMDWDIYGAKEWNGIIYNFPGGVTPGEESNEDLKLLQSDVAKRALGGAFSYEVTLAEGQYYSYVAYPYLFNGDDKLYLNPLDGLTIVSGARVVPTITNNQINLSLSGISNYKITSAILYASRNTNTKGSHIENKDVINLVKDNDEYLNELNSNFLNILNLVTKDKSVTWGGSTSWGNTDNTYSWYLAEVYSNLDENSSLTNITLGDLGNSEKENNYYKADLVISSPDILNGKPITIKGDYYVEGIVHQMPIGNSSENEMYLLDLVGLISSFAGDDIDLSDFIN